MRQYKRISNRSVAVISVLSLSLLMMITANASILTWAYGIHQPRVENERSILKAAKKYRLDPHTIVTIDPAGYREMFAQFKRSLPEALIFDKHGKYIEYRKTDSDCNAGLFTFIPNLTASGSYIVASVRTVNNLVTHFRDLHGKDLKNGYLDTTADYYVLISWAAFSGRLNKDHVRAWQNMALQNRHAKIQVIEVNFDIQEWWPGAARDTILRQGR